MPDKVEAALKAKKHRSPAYPGINLAQAIRRAGEFYQAEHKNPASIVAAASHWKYGLKSSGLQVAVAALKSFGLLAELEQGGARVFQLSALGLKIVADKRPQSEEREAAIKEAALKPKIHAEIWTKYNGQLPSDPELAYQLDHTWNFNVNAIPSFIKQLRETIAFAKLSKSDSLSPTLEDNVNGSMVGDLDEDEQVDEFKPARIKAKQRDSGGGNMKQDVFSLSEGEAVLSWPTPLSAESIADIKDWLKIMERKISRSIESQDPQEPSQE